MLATNKRRSIPGLGPGGGLATCAVLPVHMGRVGQATAQAAGDTWDMWRVVLTLAVNCSLNLQMQHVVSGAELGHSLPELETNLRKISQLQYVDMKLVGMP